MLRGWKKNKKVSQLSSGGFFYGASSNFYPPNSWAWSNSCCCRVTVPCSDFCKQRFHPCSPHQRLGRLCFKAKRTQRSWSCLYLTKPGQTACIEDLSSLLGKHTWAGERPGRRCSERHPTTARE